ncbi:MAG: hypothetical protein M1301_05475 [Candidatus Thermoplasmatota archaeon]|jgi:hypothetical protein|nr:hypothetical protein [Candidatus Thermoplasmatota archaeon]
MDISVELEFDDPNAVDLLRVIDPDNDNMISLEVLGSHAKITISQLKLSSLYNIIDDLIRDIEVGKNIESDF